MKYNKLYELVHALDFGHSNNNKMADSKSSALYIK